MLNPHNEYLKSLMTIETRTSEWCPANHLGNQLKRFPCGSWKGAEKDASSSKSSGSSSLPHPEDPVYRPKQVPPEFSVQYGQRLSDGHHPKDVFESLSCRAPFAIKLKNGSSSF